MLCDNGVTVTSFPRFKVLEGQTKSGSDHYRKCSSLVGLYSVSAEKVALIDKYSEDRGSAERTLFFGICASGQKMAQIFYRRVSGTLISKAV